MPVCYEIPPEPMQRICEENFQHPVFVCLNPKGQIGPGTMGHIEWVFSPLEARTYSVGFPSTQLSDGPWGRPWRCQHN